MAVKGLGIILDVQNNGTTTFDVQIKVIGADATSMVSSQWVTGIPYGLTTIDFDAAIKQAVKDILITNLGFSFGLLDSVRVIGASLL